MARVAGVSLGSASRVLNNASNVTPDVRERVEQAVERLGYRPNHVARSLRSRVSKSIGMMFTDLANPLYARVFQAVEAHLNRVGYMPLLANGLNVVEREVELLDVFCSRAMDGVIITPGSEHDPRMLAAVRGLPMPTVIYDRDLDVERDFLLIEHEEALCELVSRLVALGHRRISLVVSKGEVRPIRCRVDGFRAGFRKHGIEVPEDLILRLPSVMSPAFDPVHAMLGQDSPPTAILSLGTHMLGDVLNAIAARGLRIPEDISLMSIGDPEFVRSHRPSISTLWTDPERVAEALVSLLLERMKNPRAKPVRLRLMPEYLERESCSRAPVTPKRRHRA